MRRRGIVFVALLWACEGPRADPSRSDVTDSLVGTWKVLSHLPAAASDSTTLRPLGARPRGYLVYDGTGHVLWQVLSSGAADSLAARSWRNAPDSILKPLLDQFRAWFGTYTVDRDARRVTHRIEGEFLPRAGHVEVATPFRLSGDTLVLGADSLERWIFIRVR